MGFLWITHDFLHRLKTHRWVPPEFFFFTGFQWRIMKGAMTMFVTDWTHLHHPRMGRWKPIDLASGHSMCNGKSPCYFRYKSSKIVYKLKQAMFYSYILNKQMVGHFRPKNMVSCTCSFLHRLSLRWKPAIWWKKGWIWV